MIKMRWRIFDRFTEVHREERGKGVFESGARGDVWPSEPDGSAMRSAGRLREYSIYVNRHGHSKMDLTHVTLLNLLILGQQNVKSLPPQS